MLAVDASEAYRLFRLNAMGIHHRAIQQRSHNLPHPTKVVPFGTYGAGLWTGHPIGLLIVIGLLFMGLVGLPQARWFFALAIPAGAICGLFMWLRHRNRLTGR
jgi:hypothetical protein